MNIIHLGIACYLFFPNWLNVITRISAFRVVVNNNNNNNNDNNNYKNKDINKNINISIHKLTPKLIT